MRRSIILKGLRSRFEKHHNIVYTNEALEAAARLSDRYISERHLPDKRLILSTKLVHTNIYVLSGTKSVIDVEDIERW